jgi:site-specific DNA-adenine methylase
LTETQHFIEDIKCAALYFAANRCSFSGLTGKGFSFPCAQHQFTQSSIQRVEVLDLSRMEFKCLDFRQSILLAQNDPQCFLFLDPRYALAEQKNVHQGTFHRSFPHKELANVLKQSKTK